MTDYTELRRTEIARTQKVIAVIAGLVGLTVCLINFISKLDTHGIAGAFMRTEVVVLLLLSALMLVTGYINSNIIRGIQISVGFMTGIIGILDVYYSIHGIGLVILFIIVAFRYGFFEKRPRIKIASIIIGIFALIEFSASRTHAGNNWMVGLDSILYLALFLTILYFLYSSEINAYISKNNAAEKTIGELEKERDEMTSTLENLNMRIARMKSESETVDLDSLGLTDREKEVIEALVVYRETDKALADRLGIKYQTIKVHFRNIRDKLGVDRREEIIDMCRNNF